MSLDELKRLHAAWQKADEAYRPGAVDDCARADELAEAVNALFDPMAEALPALIECAEALERIDALVDPASLPGVDADIREIARAALTALKEAGNG